MKKNKENSGSEGKNLKDYYVTANKINVFVFLSMPYNFHFILVLAAVRKARLLIGFIGTVGSRWVRKVQNSNAFICLSNKKFCYSFY